MPKKRAPRKMVVNGKTYQKSQWLPNPQPNPLPTNPISLETVLQKSMLPAHFARTTSDELWDDRLADFLNSSTFNDWLSDQENRSAFVDAVKTGYYEGELQATIDHYGLHADSFISHDSKENISDARDRLEDEYEKWCNHQRSRDPGWDYPSYEEMKSCKTVHSLYVNSDEPKRLHAAQSDAYVQEMLYDYLYEEEQKADRKAKIEHERKLQKAKAKRAEQGLYALIPEHTYPDMPYYQYLKHDWVIQNLDSENLSERPLVQAARDYVSAHIRTMMQASTDAEDRLDKQINTYHNGNRGIKNNNIDMYKFRNAVEAAHREEVQYVPNWANSITGN